MIGRAAVRGGCRWQPASLGPPRCLPSHRLHRVRRALRGSRVRGGPEVVQNRELYRNASCTELRATRRSVVEPTGTPASAATRRWVRPTIPCTGIRARAASRMRWRRCGSWGAMGACWIEGHHSGDHEGDTGDLGGTERFAEEQRADDEDQGGAQTGPHRLREAHVHPVRGADGIALGGPKPAGPRLSVPRPCATVGRRARCRAPGGRSTHYRRVTAYRRGRPRPRIRGPPPDRWPARSPSWSPTAGCAPPWPAHPQLHRAACHHHPGAIPVAQQAYGPVDQPFAIEQHVGLGLSEAPAGARGEYQSRGVDSCGYVIHAEVVADDQLPGGSIPSRAVCTWCNRSTSPRNPVTLSW